MAEIDGSGIVAEGTAGEAGAQVELKRRAAGEAVVSACPVAGVALGGAVAAGPGGLRVIAGGRDAVRNAVVAGVEEEATGAAEAVGGCA